MDRPTDSSGTPERPLTFQPVSESSLKRWILLDGNRLVLTALLSGGIFLTTLVLALIGLVPVRDADAVTTLLRALVGGTLPFLTIVLAINQLVLSQELGWTDKLRARYEDALDFRRSVEASTHTPVSPAAPSDFLMLLVRTLLSDSQRLRSTCANSPDERLRADVDRYVARFDEDADDILSALEGARFGTFDALSAVLGFYTGQYLYLARSIRSRHAETIPEDGHEALDRIVELLGQLDVARQYFKTLYMQHELASLSLYLLYVGIPALVGGGFLILVYEQILTLPLGIWALSALAALAVTDIFLPFSVLLTYALRIATVASRTADFGPFVPRSKGREPSRIDR